MQWIIVGRYGWPETSIARTEDFPEEKRTEIYTQGLSAHDGRVTLLDADREAFWLQIVGA